MCGIVSESNCLCLFLGLLRYRSSRFALQAQLNRNEQCMLGDHTSESVTPTDLQKRLRELKVMQCFKVGHLIILLIFKWQLLYKIFLSGFKSLWDETESLWKEYEALCMQCVQYNERPIEQDRMELTVRWREQRSQLQGRYVCALCVSYDHVRHYITLTFKAV